jgi:uncharacterized membrane protein YoaK (UPF0700 family)
MNRDHTSYRNWVFILTLSHILAVASGAVFGAVLLEYPGRPPNIFTSQGWLALLLLSVGGVLATIAFACLKRKAKNYVILYVYVALWFFIVLYDPIVRSHHSTAWLSFTTVLVVAMFVLSYVSEFSWVCLLPGIVLTEYLCSMMIGYNLHVGDFHTGFFRYFNS